MVKRATPGYTRSATKRDLWWPESLKTQPSRQPDDPRQVAEGLFVLTTLLRLCKSKFEKWGQQKVQFGGAKTRDLSEICDDHQRICDQIMKRDPMGAAMAMREHLAVSSRLIIAQETGDLRDVEKFEPTWIDLLTLQRIQFGEQPSDAKATHPSGSQVVESMRGESDPIDRISQTSAELAQFRLGPKR